MFCPMRGGFFILQLHDELLYEVAEEDVVQVFFSVSLLCWQQTVGVGMTGSLHIVFRPSLAQAGCVTVDSL